MNKVIVVNKEENLTSRDVVNKLSQILGIKKIGHCGTLDPMAKGVLVCLTGKYTKLVNLITSKEKEYISEIKLGIKTDTLDITGNIIEEKPLNNLTKEDILKVFQNLKGEYQETIPLYSAVHVKGKRLYEYARRNIEVELPQKTVYIKELELLDFHNDIIKFKCLVSKGTYIRSLIETICNNLNVIGTMNSLIRTKQGNFTLENAYTLEDIKNNNYQSLSIEDVLEVKVKEVSSNSKLYNYIINGNKLNLDYNGYVLFKCFNEELALYEFINKEGRLIIKIKE